MKTFIAALVVGLVVAVALAMLLSAPAVAGKGDVAAGKTVYTKKCATCHAAAGEGKEAIFKMLKAEVKHLGSKEVQAKTDAEWRKDITQGIGKMKPVTGLTEKELDDLMAFARTLATK